MHTISLRGPKCEACWMLTGLLDGLLDYFLGGLTLAPKYQGSLLNAYPKYASLLGKKISLLAFVSCLGIGMYTMQYRRKR